MMNLEGLEMIVVLVIIVAFVKALEHMGLLEDPFEGRLLKLKNVCILEKLLCYLKFYFNICVCSMKRG